MNSIKTIVLVLLVCLQVSATEVEDYCKLQKAQAEAKSSTLAWPKIYGTVGIEPTVSTTLVYGGMSQSVSGIFQALAINDRSYYQCLLYASEKDLTDTISHFDDQIFMRQADAQRSLLKEALKLAEQNVEIENELFKSQNSSLLELQSAHTQRGKVQSALVELEQKLSQIRDIPQIDTNLDLRKRVDDSRNYFAKVTYLNSAATTLSAWDLVANGGARYDLQQGTVAGYATVNLTYSFGHIMSSIKTSSLEGLARKYTSSQINSTQNLFARFLQSKIETLASEKENNRYLLRQVKTTQEMIDRIGSVDTIRAKRIKRNLAVEQLMLKANLAGSTAKVDELEKWVNTNDRSGRSSD